MLIARLQRPVLLKSLPVTRNLFATSSQPREASEDDVKQARDWLSKFHADTIPRGLCDFSFSRSSGPGGQNVNKVNSKATLKISLAALQPFIPKLIWPGIVQSRYATHNCGLIIQADDSRKQQDNIKGCLKKLNELIVQVGHGAVPGETSDAQKLRVKALAKSSNEFRLKTKRFNSSKKSARRNNERSEF